MNSDCYLCTGSMCVRFMAVLFGEPVLIMCGRTSKEKQRIREYQNVTGNKKITNDFINSNQTLTSILYSLTVY